MRSDSLQYHLAAAPQLPTGFDYNHLEWDSVQLQLDSFYYNNLDILANIEQFQLKDKQDFELQQLKTKLALHLIRSIFEIW